MCELLEKSGFMVFICRGLKEGIFREGMPSMRCCLMHSAVAVISWGDSSSFVENAAKNVWAIKTLIIINFWAIGKFTSNN